MRTKKHYKRTKASPYQVYKRLYNKAQKSLSKRGVKMHDKMLNYQEWKEYYRSEVQRNVELREEGRPINKNINRSIVAAQKYKKSYQYSRSLARAINTIREEKYDKEFERVRIRDIQEDNINYDELDDEYWRLKDMGLTPQEAAEEIAGLYFGS